MNLEITKRSLDDQNAIKKHSMHEPLHINEHINMAIGRVFKSPH